MPRDLIKLNAELDSGITPSLKQGDVPFWKDGLNVAFTGSAIRPIFPQRDVTFTLAANPIRGRILETRISGTPYAFYGDYRKLFRFDGTTVTDVSRAVGGAYNGVINETLVKPATMWSFAQWGNWVFAAQENDALQKYTGSGVFANLTTTFTSAALIIAYKSFLIAMNTNVGADFIHWCSSDDTNLWAPAVGNSAGLLQARDAGPILAVCLFRGNVVFATAKSIHILRFVGAPNWFGQDILIDNVGVAGKDCLIPIGASLYGLNSDGLWVSDGVTAKQLDEPAIHDFFVSRLNQDQASKMHLWYNLAENHVEAHFPTETTEPDLVITRREDNNLWSILDRAVTATSPGQVFPFALTGTANGRLMGQTRDDSGTLRFDGSDITAGGGQAKPGPLSAEENVIMQVGYGDGGYGEVGYGGTAYSGQRPEDMAVFLGYGKVPYDATYGDFIFTIETWYETQDRYAGNLGTLFRVGSLMVHELNGNIVVEALGNPAALAVYPNAITPGTWDTYTLDCGPSTNRYRLFKNGTLLGEVTGPPLDPFDMVLWGQDEEIPPTDIFTGFLRQVSVISRTAVITLGVVDQTYFTDPEKLKRLVADLYWLGDPKLYNYWPLNGQFALAASRAAIDLGKKYLGLYVGASSYISAPDPAFNAIRLTGRSTSDATVIMIQTDSNGNQISFGAGGSDLRSAFVESKYLDGEDPRLSKHIFNVISEVENRPLDSLKLTLLLKETLDQKIPLAVTLDMDKPTLKKKIRGSKYIAFRIEDPSVDTIWRLTKLFANATSGGSRIK